jgi:predicted phage-related endonuclease
MSGQIQRIAESTIMKSLDKRRQELLRELAQINRQIVETQKSITQIESKIDGLQDCPQAKAA